MGTPDFYQQDIDLQYAQLKNQNPAKLRRFLKAAAHPMSIREKVASSLKPTWKGSCRRRKGYKKRKRRYRKKKRRYRKRRY